MITIEGDILLIEGVPFPEAYLEVRDNDLTRDMGENISQILETETPTFKVRSATIDFESGWTLVVSWGNGDHCSNYTRGMTSDLPFLEDSPDAEISAFHEDGRWWDFDKEVFVHDDCPSMPYVLSKDVLFHAITFGSNLAPKEKIPS